MHEGERAPPAGRESHPVSHSVSDLFKSNSSMIELLRFVCEQVKLPVFSNQLFINSLLFMKSCLIVYLTSLSTEPLT